MGLLCPSMPLLPGTRWGHCALTPRHKVGTLCPCSQCFFPFVVSSKFFLKEINGNVHNQTTLYYLTCGKPATGQCHCPPCTSHPDLAGRHQPRVGGCQHPPWPRTARQAGLYPHMTVPTGGGAAGDSSDALGWPKASGHGKTRASRGLLRRGQGSRDARRGRCFPHDSSFVP